MKFLINLIIVLIFLIGINNVQARRKIRYTKSKRSKTRNLKKYFTIHYLILLNNLRVCSISLFKLELRTRPSFDNFVLSV